MVAISEAALRGLVHQTLDAAVDAQRWPGLVQAVAETCGAMGGLMFGCSLAQPERSFMLNSGLDPDINRMFAQQYQDNPWTRAGAAWQGGGAFDIAALVEHRLVARTEFHADVLRPQGIRTMTGIKLPLGSGFDIAGISLAFDAHGAEAPRGAVALLDALAPLLRRAAAVSLHLHAAEARAQGLAAALDAMPQAALLLAADARVLFANGRAERLLAAGDGLHVEAGRLGAARPADTQALRRLVGAAAGVAEGRVSGSPDALAVARPSGRAPLSLLATPVRDLHAQLPLPGLPAAMLLVSGGDEPTTPPQQAAARLQALFGLTPTEARVALQVAQGASGPEAAAALGIGAGTVHAHLKSIFAKTGVRRQSGLARLLTRSGVLDIL
jgi:DNA-binding CsgD family transcriptional regulator/PAS domain-containing protein